MSFRRVRTRYKRYSKRVLGRHHRRGIIPRRIRRKY